MWQSKIESHPVPHQTNIPLRYQTVADDTIGLETFIPYSSISHPSSSFLPERLK